MFSKSPDTIPTPSLSGQLTRPSGATTRSVLASDLRITGEVSSTGTIEVLGEIEGNLTAQGLIVGAEGRMNGTVSAETVEVKGHLDGSVTTQSFALRATADVAADVTYSTLVIESGAQIAGKFTLNRA